MYFVLNSCSLKIFKQKRDLMEKQDMLSKKRFWELFWKKKAECKEALGKEKEQEVAICYCKVKSGIVFQ